MLHTVQTVLRLTDPPLEPPSLAPASRRCNPPLRQHDTPYYAQARSSNDGAIHGNHRWQPTLRESIHESWTEPRQPEAQEQSKSSNWPAWRPDPDVRNRATPPSKAPTRAYNNELHQYNLQASFPAKAGVTHPIGAKPPAKTKPPIGPNRRPTPPASINVLVGPKPHISVMRDVNRNPTPPVSTRNQQHDLPRRHDSNR